MANVEGIKWGLESDDQRIKFDLTTLYRDMNNVVSYGQVFFDGKKACDAGIALPDDVFKNPRKPRPGNKMLTYALAYYLSLIIVNTVEKKNGNMKGINSNKAKGLALELLGTECKADGSSIDKARKKYPIPREGKIHVNHDPLGIIVLLDERNIVKSNNEELIYKGIMWAWRKGDSEAKEGYGEVKI
ncbi:hypothetical protein [Methylomonas methanica]|uniref:Uncharacterized protein n=1 Tax=Methylomonas methanica (strain DSM 25384 / MC09) TaxID=857087 RepID=G0A3U3_METMM|nr:hypothetical protein [Methylomonas methanica]AEG02715.1 hypothetical protein Metme_4367 [Methylomonas methanica MC09]